jgi:hypothetical protein
MGLQGESTQPPITLPLNGKLPKKKSLGERKTKNQWILQKITCLSDV